jgi:hypothetical protein
MTDLTAIDDNALPPLDTAEQERVFQEATKTPIPSAVVLPEMAPDWNPALGSVFANESDLRRYAEARARGASEQEALMVGDNGRGAWGDDTTSQNIPMVALPVETEGMRHGRLVRVQGPHGTVIAKVADKMGSNLVSGAGIDLNPAAAHIVGHPGGVVPVRWAWADDADGHDTVVNTPRRRRQYAPVYAQESAGGRTAQRLPAAAFLSEAGEENPLAISTEDLTSDSTLDQGDTGESAANITPETAMALMEPQQPEGAEAGGMAPPPPSMQGVRMERQNPDGTIRLSNGADWNPRDKSITYWAGDKRFWSGAPGSTPRDVTPHPVRTTKIDDITGEPRIVNISPATGRVTADLGPDPKMMADLDKRMQTAGLDTNDLKTGKPLSYMQKMTELNRYNMMLKGTDLPAGATGEAALQGLTEQQKATVRGIANYQINPSSLGRASDRQLFVSRAALFDPTYDQNKFNQRRVLLGDLASQRPGTMGGSKKSLNQAIEHLHDLDDLAGRLNNRDFRAYNNVRNIVAKQAGKRPEVNQFNTTLTAITNELERFFSQAAPTVGGREHWRDAIDAANSPAQLKAVIRETIPKLMSGGLNSMSDQYSDIMGKRPEKPFMTDRSRNLLKKMGVSPEEMEGTGLSEQPAVGGAPIAGAPAPVRDMTPDQHAAMATQAKAILADPKQPPDRKAAAQRVLEAQQRAGLLGEPSPAPTP